MIIAACEPAAIAPAAGRRCARLRYHMRSRLNRTYSPYAPLVDRGAYRICECRRPQLMRPVPATSWHG